MSSSESPPEGADKQTPVAPRLFDDKTSPLSAQVSAKAMTTKSGLTIGISAEVPMNVGAMLRKAREHKGFSIEDCAEQLRIRPAYLIAIEAEKLTELPPTRTTVRSYVKSYAQILSLVPEEILQKFNDTHYLTPTSMANKPKPLPSVPSGLLMYSLAGILLVVFLIGVVQSFVWQDTETTRRAVFAPLPKPEEGEPPTSSVAVEARDAGDDNMVEVDIAPPPQEKFLEVTNLPPEETEPLIANRADETPSAAEPSTVVAPSQKTPLLVDIPRMVRLENTLPLWVGLRGGSLDQDYFALLDAEEGIEFPADEGIMLHVRDWTNVRLTVQSDNAEPAELVTVSIPKDVLWLPIDEYLPPRLKEV